MRKRLVWALLAGPAAVFAGFGLLAGSAVGAPTATAQGPTLGPASATLGMAGYQAGGKQFRWISATILVPDHQSEEFSSTCVITAPSFVATVQGDQAAVKGERTTLMAERTTLRGEQLDGPSNSLVVTDVTRGKKLTADTDYTVSPTPDVGLTNGPYTITLIHTSNWSPGDTIAVTTTTGATVTLDTPVNGTISLNQFLPAAPTCGPVTVEPTQIVVYNVTKSVGLVQGADYTVTKMPPSSLTLNLLSGSMKWAYGDTLKVTNEVWHSAYIQLSNGSLGNKGGQYGRTGIEPCAMAMAEQTWPSAQTCADGSWVAFIETFRNAMSPIPRFSHYVPLNVSKGDGVGFSIYYNLGGNELFFHITPPTPAPDIEVQVNARGGIFNFAAALDDTTNTAGDPVVLPVFLHHVRVGLFVQGAITTVNGQKGSFVGPWTTRPVVATSNGLPFPAGTARIVPTALFSDGLPANGAVRPWDAFAVFLR